MTIEFSVSTWRQPMPSTPTATRARVVDRLASMIEACGDGRIRIAVDGLTASGKTSLGHEIARVLAARGRPVLRASLDDFKRPWRDAHLYDRTSGTGYYRNAFDYDVVRTLLVEPSADGGEGLLALCSIDPRTQVDHSGVKVAIPENGILIVDGVFACRPELNDAWHLRIWVDIDPELSLQRGSTRDVAMHADRTAGESLQRDRYLASELLYIEEVDPLAFVEVIVDNTDFDAPRLVRPR